MIPPDGRPCKGFRDTRRDPDAIALMALAAVP
jgi:hypothetical protein